MRDIGLAATELGPDGFLPADPDADGHGAHRPPADRRRRLHARGDAPPRTRPAPRDRPHPGAVPGHAGRGPGAVRHLRTRRLRHPSHPGRRRLGPAAEQPQPDQRPGRRTRCPRSAAPPRGHHDRERRRGAAGAQRLLHLAVPGHRSPADRRHRPGGPDPAGTRPHRAHPPQGRRQQHRRQGPCRAAELHRGRGRGHVPTSGHRRRRRRSHREHVARQRLHRLVHPGAGHHPHRGAPRRGARHRRTNERRPRPQPAHHDRRTGDTR